MVRKYTSEDIQVLDDRQHVLLYPSMYVGSTEPEVRWVHLYDPAGKVFFQEVTIVPALYKILEEVLSNSIDEHFKGTATRIEVTLSEDHKTITVKDNGAGIPIGIHPVIKKPTPEVVLTTLRSGSNFEQKKDISTLGLYGMGVSLTTFMSSSLRVRIQREGKLYDQEFRNNAKDKSEPEITAANGKETFTEITLTPDYSRLNSTEFDPGIVRKILRDYSHLFPGLLFSFRNGSSQEEFSEKRGLLGFLEKLGVEPKDYVISSQKGKFGVCEVAVVPREESYGSVEQVSFVNGANTFRGGTHYEFLMSYLKQELRVKAAKKLKLDLKPKDIDNGIFTITFLTILNPRFEGQAKEKLVSSKGDLEPYFGHVLKPSYLQSLLSNETLMSKLSEEAEFRIQRSSKAKLRSEEGKKSRKLVKRLVPCSTPNREEAALYIVEGMSALSNGVYVRDVARMAFFPIKGKPLNVYKCSKNRILENAELSELMSVLGLSLMDKSLDGLRYGKIVILSDSDEDGGQIRSLLIVFLYTFWPELFSKGIVAFLESPRYVIEFKDGSKKYCYTKEELSDFSKSSASDYVTMYIKGLGSLDIEDWKFMLIENPRMREVEIDPNCDSSLKLAFGEETEERKKWIQS